MCIYRRVCTLERLRSITFKREQSLDYLKCTVGKLGEGVSINCDLNTHYEYLETIIYILIIN